MQLALIKMMLKEPVCNWDPWCLKAYSDDDLIIIRRRFPTSVHMIGYFLNQPIVLSHESLQRDMFDSGAHYLEFFYKHLRIVRKIWEHCLSSLSMAVFLYERFLGIFKYIELSKSWTYYQKTTVDFIIVTIDLIKSGDIHVALMAWDQRCQDVCS
jgi:hypothetical protein